MQTKLAFIDLETTGLWPSKHSIWQIGCVFDIDGSTVDTFNNTMKPIEKLQSAPEGCTIDMTALDKYPLSWWVYEELLGCMKPLIDKFNKQDKFHFVGYNADFDYQFMRTWFFKHMKNKFFSSWFWNPPIDIMQIAAVKLMKERHELKDFKLATVAAYMGLKVDESLAHDAYYDIKLTKDLYYTLRGGEI